MNDPLSVRLQAVPLHEPIKSRQRKRQACLESGPGAMRDFLEMTDARQPRQHRLHQHPCIPRAPRAELQIAGIAYFGVEACIAQDAHLLLKGFNARVKGGVGRMGPGTIPGHHQAQVNEQQTELTADDPAPVGFAFAADLLGTPPFPQGVEQFNPITIDPPQDRGCGQKLLRPSLGGGKEPKEARALGQRRQQAAPIAAHPSGKRPVAAAFEGKEAAQGANLPGPQTGLRVFSSAPHRLIYPVKPFADKVRGSHAAFPVRCVGLATRSLGAPHGAFQAPLKLAPFVTNPPSRDSYARFRSWCTGPES